MGGLISLSNLVKVSLKFRLCCGVVCLLILVCFASETKIHISKKNF